MEHVARRPEAVVGRQDDGRLRAGDGHELCNEPVERAEVPLAALDHLALPARRTRRAAGRVDKAPAEVLQLVHPVEQHADQVGGLLVHQQTGDLKPALLARDMKLDPVGVLVVGTALDRLDLELHIQ